MKIKGIFIFLFLSFLTLSISAAEKKQNANSIFSAANRLYSETKYDAAILEYKRLLNQGIRGGNLYYNLGNCYFKKGKLGKAILNYERARKFIPRDRDLKANCAYANSLIKGKITPRKKIWMGRVIARFFSQFTINEITIILAIIYFFLLLIIAFSVVFKTLRIKFLIGFSALLLFFALGTASLHQRRILINKEAIIQAERVEAKFEPFEQATTYFKLYAGMKVELLALRENWCKIKRIDGRIGWMMKSELSKLSKN